MKNRRLLALLLAFCMVFSNLAMGVSAVEAPADSVVNAEHETEATVAATESAVSPFANDKLVSGAEAVHSDGLKSLRDDDVIVKSELTESTETVEGAWEFAPADAPAVSLLPEEVPECIEELHKAAELFNADENVHAFVVMKDAPLANAYTSKPLASASAEKELLQKQDAVIASIERAVLGGEKLNVRYQFTYLTNSFSIETQFANLEKIAKLDGVKSVFIMPVYNAIPTNETASPNTAGAALMTGVTQVWEDLGYTGKGMKIAVIDTGLDLDHPSFAAEPETTDSSLTVADIEAVLEDLNAYAKRSSITAKTLYRSAKVPYAFNYVDNSLTADHSADMQGDHGTHVSGIAAANELAGTPVKGMAPDAQIIVMKVFGAAGGAYTDDIVAALEDAMTLGCDVVNASLGPPAGFCSTDTEIDLIYDRLASQDIVATFSAGNEGTSSYQNMWGTDLNRTSNPDNATVGQPGIFNNVMTIASADNAVVMGDYFTVGSNKVFYMDNYEYLLEQVPWSLRDLAEMEMEYVIIDGLGEEEKFYDADGNSLVEGKVAIVKRGELSFAQKCMNAENAGAAACIIWNNNDTDDIYSFGMTTADEAAGYYPGIPVGLITLSDGNMMAEAETKTLVVAKEMGQRADANGGQMSSFSSWGVSPELGLEPDITGIGGNVYSCYDGGEYGLMSGTSMSAPQVAGVTALVMQRLYALYPNAPDGTVRELAEAMLMSTANPIIDKTFGFVEASPRQQGAGLVDAYQAVTSDVYLTVKGEKPKAELGDSSTGKYTFSFEIHNIGKEAVTYDLAGTLNTEYPADGGGIYFMYGADMPLDGSVSFDKESVTVPAGGNANVTVTVALSEEDKAFFRECWENGGYVEGYIYLVSSNEEGEITSQLNLPYLGFYGDWTKAPVFDTAYWYDNTFWGLAPAGGLPEGDEYYNVLWTDLGGQDWVLGMNPYSGAYADANGNIAYDPAHNVVSPNGDGVLDGIAEIYLSLLRNAKTLTFTWTVDGKVMDRETITHNQKTMYWSNQGRVIPWIYSWYGYGLYDFTDVEGNALPTGTEVLLTIDATVDYGTGGSHSIQIPMTVDTTPGQILATQSAQLDDGTDVLAVMASDETALAAVVLMNPTGTQMYAQAYDATMQDAGNGAYIAYFDVSDLGTEFLVAVCDYAANEAYYEVTYKAADGNLPVMDTDALYAYRVFDDAIYSDHMYGWVSLDKPVAGEKAALSVWTDDYLEYAAINAAEYVDGKIFAVDAVYNLVVMDPGLFNRQTICNLGVNVIDMTFDDSTDTMYVLSKQGNYMYLYSMDLTTGALTQLKNFGYYTGNAPYAIADDDNGTIYAIKYNSANIFTLDVENGYALTAVTTTVDGVENKVTITDSDGNNAGPNYAQGLTWSDGKLYWAYFKNYYNYYLYSDLITIDTATWEHFAVDYTSWAYDADNQLVNYNPYTELVGLLTLTETEYQIPEATALTDLLVSEDSLLLTVGQSATVTASAQPWNYDLGEVTWTSSDESVATVSGGRITGVGAGSATVTVSSEGVSKTVEVTVIAIDGNFKAYNYYSADGNYGYMIDVDLSTLDYVLEAEAPADFLAGDYNGHDGCFYGYTEGGQFWKYDVEAGTAVKLGTPTGVVPSDMAYDYSTGLLYAATLDVNTYVGAIHVVDPCTGAMEPVYMGEGLLLITLACDGEGNLYTVTADGMLIKFVMRNGQPADMIAVMEGLGEVFYMQSMGWDHNNDVLLWAYTEYGTIVWMDPNAAEPYAMMLGDPTGAGPFQFVGVHTVPEKIPELSYVAVENVTAQDMLMLAGTTKTPNVSVIPFNATEKAVSLTSSDESVVKVNADGTLTAVAEGEATVAGVLTDGENTFNVEFKVTVIEGADDIYGMVLTDLASMGGQYWTRIYAQDPSDPDMLEYTDYVIYAEEYFGGKLYAVGYDPNDWEGNWQYFVMDPVNHRIEAQSDLGEGYPFVYDMTYDYTTSTMFAVAGPSDNASDLFIFNMENGELIPLLQTEQFFLSLAAGPDGTLYAMENSQEIISDEWDPWAKPEYSNATLYAIDPMAGTVEKVGDTGVMANMLASMSYDYDTDRLYWTGFYQGSANTSGLYIVDTETGAATNLGSIGMAGAQVSGLYIISEDVPEAGEASLQKLIVTPEKTSITVGATTKVNAYIVPANLKADTVWTSSDEKVATVDANGVVTGVASGKATITASVTYGGVTLTDSCEVGVLAADAAFLTYNVTDGGWAAISRVDASVTNLTEGENASAAVAVAAKGENVYGFDAELNFFSLDLTTYERTVIGTADAEAAVAGYLSFFGYSDEDIAAEKDYFTLEIRDLDYDAANDRFLALGAVVDAEYGDEMNAGDAIYEVSLTDGTLTEVHRFTEIYNVMSMTVDAEGTIYYYNSYNDYYTALNLSAGTEANIVSGQTQSMYGSTEDSHALYFDEVTGLVYHLFTSNGNFYRLLSLDPASGELKLAFEYVGEVEYDEEAWANIGDSFTGLTFVDVSLSAPAFESDVYRVSGKNRFDTSFAIADQLKEVLGTEKFEAVVVAYSHNFPDALTGSYLASVKNAPILLVNDGAIADVQAYIAENLAEDGTVYILGGTAAVSEEFEAAVSAFQVKRLKGSNRYGTNLAILEEAGVAADQEILVCTGTNYADSLSASATGLPMLMVGAELTAEQKAFLEGRTGNFTIIGGTGAVSEAVEAELQAYGTVERVKGASRYETSVAVAQRYFSEPSMVILAYAGNFPDGLCGGALASAMNVPMVLTASANTAAADAYVEGITGGLVIGGTSLISDDAAREIFDLPANALIVKGMIEMPE